MTLTFPYDPARASHASRWLLSKHGGTLDRMKLIKLIFLADRLHLARYGRPIVGGRYRAMQHGPVASEFYNQIKNNELEGTAQVGTTYRIQVVTEPDEDELSETDIEILREIDGKYGSLDSIRLRDMTHRLQAWERNYKGGGSSYPLPYEDFFRDLAPEDGAMLELIADAQEAEKALG
jgi:uncharacterized phage-associated protein